MEPDSVSVIFHRQKNFAKDAVITMDRSGLKLYPVTTWKTIMLRILSYPGTLLSSTVITLLLDKKLQFIKSKIVLLHIRQTVTLIGQHVLGFSAADVGTHSIRCSFAMFLYPNNVRADKILLQGRWHSQEFLSYIRPQVDAFSKGLSELMLKGDQFFTIITNNADMLERNIMFNPKVTYLNAKLYPREGHRLL